MAKNIHIGVSNISHKSKKIYMGGGNIAKKIKKIYTGVNGVARTSWSGSSFGTLILSQQNSNTYYNNTQEIPTSYSTFSDPIGSNFSYNKWIVYDKKNDRFVYVGKGSSSSYISIYTMTINGTAWTHCGDINGSSISSLYYMISSIYSKPSIDDSTGQLLLTVYMKSSSGSMYPFFVRVTISSSGLTTEVKSLSDSGITSFSCALTTLKKLNNFYVTSELEQTPSNNNISFKIFYSTTFLTFTAVTCYDTSEKYQNNYDSFYNQNDTPVYYINNNYYYLVHHYTYTTSPHHHLYGKKSSSLSGLSGTTSRYSCSIQQSRYQLIAKRGNKIAIQCTSVTESGLNVNNVGIWYVDITGLGSSCTPVRGSTTVPWGDTTIEDYVDDGKYTFIFPSASSKVYYTEDMITFTAITSGATHYGGRIARVTN